MLLNNKIQLISHMSGHNILNYFIHDEIAHVPRCCVENTVGLSWVLLGEHAELLSMPPSSTRSWYSFSFKFSLRVFIIYFLNWTCLVKKITSYFCSWRLYFYSYGKIFWLEVCFGCLYFNHLSIQGGFIFMWLWCHTSRRCTVARPYVWFLMFVWLHFFLSRLCMVNHSFALVGFVLILFFF